MSLLQYWHPIHCYAIHYALMALQHKDLCSLWNCCSNSPWRKPSLFYAPDSIQPCHLGSLPPHWTTWSSSWFFWGLQVTQRETERERLLGWGFAFGSSVWLLIFCSCDISFFLCLCLIKDHNVVTFPITCLRIKT